MKTLSWVPAVASLTLLVAQGCATRPPHDIANAWLEIDRGAFEHNIRAMQTELAGQAQLCAVLKADAYGHGLALLLPSVLALAVPCIAVASNEEIRTVREAGFEGRLLRVRSATQDEIAQARRYEVEEMLGNLALARLVSAAMLRQSETLPVHLALNSAGMSRSGLELATEQGRYEALELAQLPGLQIVGLMTHFPVEEKADVRRGLAAFRHEADWLVANAGLARDQIVLHSANSYATLEVPESRLDLVRVGGALFGDTVPARTEYRRVMQFKSRVAAVQRYPKGSTVGYDRSYTLQRSSLLANIPTGYADGYRRALSNKAHVLIRGQRVPVVGKVSMNALMVDVTDLADVAPGDEVVLFGRQGSAEITQPELEKINGALLADLYTIWGYANPKILKD